jgi:Uma2 family endonuclease
MTTTTEPSRGFLAPSWEVAHLFPVQGRWSESDYLNLTEHTNHLVELSDGYVEVLPMPTRRHQKIVLLLYRLIYEFMAANSLGTVLCAPLRVRLWEGKFREPDLVVMLAEHRSREHEAFFDGADLVVEVVSDDAPERDIGTKRQEYAQAGIPEYWIVDPRMEQINVLRLQGAAYQPQGEYRRGDVVPSALLAGFQVAVATVFDEK